MARRSIVVVGAGAGVGLAVARAFGRESYGVALIARTQARLDMHVETLRGQGIEVAAFVADAADPEALSAAMGAAASALGEIEVLYYGPKPGPEMLRTPREIDLAGQRAMFDRLASGAITAVNAVLPGMVERRSGSIIFAVPASAETPVLYSANMAMITAGLRNYALGLHVDLAKDGIYVGVICVAGSIVEAGEGRERHLAEDSRRPEDRGWEEYRKFEEELTTMIPAGEVGSLALDMHRLRDREEAFIGDRDICHRMRCELITEARDHDAT